ncbi:dsbA [Wigglesworthia glossinidia endosymbiont of Glossina brevipalpis]|uniref:Thiol:disulfide interchange protein n=1 Tax=Wigglesworthia glossinidia brevipalpis TaxID=36870 RepID=Q8D2U5_WIGBR|nr:dsbA [Wigglesworthia glossinidia endosymbiont of Glossina brevipalpis]
MKKLILIIFLYTGFLFGHAKIIPSEGKEYYKLDYIISDEYKIIEFFSFYCSYCYKFNSIYKINENIRNIISENDKIIKYHTNFFGPKSVDLSLIWAISTFFNVENKISDILFQEVQNNKKILNKEDILIVFNKLGISKKQYEYAKNSFLVKCFIKKQEFFLKKLNIISVPTIVINGRYVINNDKIYASSIEEYSNKYIEIIKYLLNKSI